MNRELENRFFRMFGTNGVAVLGMEHITYKYGFKSLPDDMKDFYMKSIPDIVQERTEAFDDSMFMGIDGERPTIMTEIENNLDECTDENKRERYVFDLLTPFATFSAYFRSLAEHPFAERHTACECDRYIEILGKAEQGTTEWYCKLWYRLVLYYADMLHSIFLRYGIDFYKVQKDCDVYLKDENSDVLPYGFFDSPKLAQYYNAKIGEAENIADTEIQNFVLKPDREDVRKYKALFHDLWNMNVIKGQENVFVDMCIGVMDAPKCKLVWELKNTRNKATAVQALCEFLLMIGKDEDQLTKIVLTYFGYKVSPEQKQRAKGQRGEYHLRLAEIVKKHIHE